MKIKTKIEKIVSSIWFPISYIILSVLNYVYRNKIGDTISISISIFVIIIAVYSLWVLAHKKLIKEAKKK